jgi:hypothetical protein
MQVITCDPVGMTDESCTGDGRHAVQMLSLQQAAKQAARTAEGGAVAVCSAVLPLLPIYLTICACAVWCLLYHHTTTELEALLLSLKAEPPAAASKSPRAQEPASERTTSVLHTALSQEVQHACACMHTRTHDAARAKHVSVCTRAHAHGMHSAHMHSPLPSSSSPSSRRLLRVSGPHLCCTPRRTR